MGGYLKYQARQDRPDVEELEKLANSVEEFTTCLIDPLKSDTKDREAFGDTLDLIIDKAIEYNQGKVHPYLNLCEFKSRMSSFQMALTSKERVNVRNGLFDDVNQLTLATLQPTLAPNVWLRSSDGIAQVRGHEFESYFFFFFFFFFEGGGGGIGFFNFQFIKLENSLQGSFLTYHVTYTDCSH